MYLDHIKLVDEKSGITIQKLDFVDLPKLVEIRNLSKEWLHNNSAFSLDDAKNWYNETPNQYFKILLKDKIIGYFRTSDWVPQYKRCTIGADLHPDFRGKGLAKAAYKLFLDFLFNELNFNKVSLEVLDFNTRAYNLYLSIGFKEEGRKKQDLLRDNKWHDSILMAILREDWAMIPIKEYIND